MKKTCDEKEMKEGRRKEEQEEREEGRKEKEMESEAGGRKKVGRKVKGTEILQGNENVLQFPLIAIQSILVSDIIGEGTRRYKLPGIKY